MTEGSILRGFGNHFSTEAVEGALPARGNSPQKAPFGLYAEQLSGSSFVAPRHENFRSWLYRIRPAAVHGTFHPVDSGRFLSGALSDASVSPNQMRWNPLPLPRPSTDFLHGIFTMALNGSPLDQKGGAVHLYAINDSMANSFFVCNDGDFLFVPEQGELELRTELGVLHVAPKEIAVIPRGIRFQVKVKGPCRGYLCENYGAPFRLPPLGVIGANGLASPNDFVSPAASYEDREGRFELFCKVGGRLWRASLEHSPLDVVAWRGNYAPYKYDLKQFNTIGTVSFDHPDPSIFTVLTSPSETPGVANLDFVIFPPRWMVAENTFRPPYFHRNVMSEWMGLIHGVYDAKATGFLPGGSSLHNCMSGHGPDAATFEAASSAALAPHYVADTLAFMVESRYPFHTTPFAENGGLLQDDYQDCWRSLKKSFSLGDRNR